MIKVIGIHSHSKGSEDMVNKNQNTKQPDKHNTEVSFKGTFIAVMLLGVFILITWFGSYVLFLSR
ncbi:cytochrome c oxidase subunit 2A [Sporosarcina sp. FA9]|uniref:cytochrome c oxidase subunit 2A n=1 Tax=Sporosarcina sp. FA9 TaxID=3413030 RepID=UPI003F6566D2